MKNKLGISSLTEYIKSHSALFILLFIGWLLFTWNFTYTSMLIGIMASSLLTVSSSFFFSSDKDKRDANPGLLSILKLLFRLIYEIYIASFSYIITIVKHDNNPTITEIYLDTDNPLSVTLISNAITLTPGTITVDTDGNKILVLSIKDDEAEGESITKDIKHKFERLLTNKHAKRG
ncbi:MAG: Na+/H+ antiporter subunit E [Bacillota bacterium]